MSKTVLVMKTHVNLLNPLFLVVYRAMLHELFTHLTLSPQEMLKNNAHPLPSAPYELTKVSAPIRIQWPRLCWA